MSSVSAVNSLLGSSTAATQSINLSSLLTAATGATSTGIDVTAAVNAAVYAAQAPERQWQSEVTTLQSQAGVFTQLQSSVSSLTNDLKSLNDLNGPLSARSASSTNAAIASATATPGTAVGNHTLIVDRLASTASWYSPAVASRSSALGTGTLQITTQAGASAQVTLGSGVNTLDQLVTTINTQNLGVTASIVNDAKGSRLSILSNSSGSAAGFSVTSSSTSSSTWNSASLPNSATLSANSFTLGDGQQTTSIAVSSGETLQQLANSINNTGLAVNATVVTDTSGSHLSITNTTPGAAVSLSTDPVFAFTEATAGANASLSIDGIPISSATNTVTGALPGLSINLANAAPGVAVGLSVSPDASQITSALTQFVTDYNSALALVNSQFSYSSSTSSQGVLGSDPTLRSLQSTLMQAISYTAQGATSGVSTLASLGISMGHDGSLTLDTAKLGSVVQKNPDSVQTFVQGISLNGFAGSLIKQLNHFSNSASGAFTVSLRSTKKQISDLSAQISTYEATYVANQRTLLTSMFSKAEIALQQLPAQMKQIQAQLGNTNGG